MAFYELKERSYESAQRGGRRVTEMIKEAKELLKHHEMIRVCSKYPVIAKDYFYNKKHQTVDIIKLNVFIKILIRS